MKLVFKLPPGKLPFIGIHFSYENEGSALNQDLIELHRDSVFKVAFEFHRTFININLISQQGPVIRHYKHLAYDDIKSASDWFSYTGNNSYKHINFGHITGSANNHTIIKTQDKCLNFVLKVEAYSIEKMDGFTERLKEMMMGKSRVSYY